MKSMTDLWRELAKELASWCHTSTALDHKKVESRTEAEGLSFLTITLPSFGKEFERCLELGLLDDDSFPGFRKKNGFPLFLGGFLRQIFDPSDCALFTEPSLDSIFAIRQLTLLFAKILVPCSDDRERDAFLDYVKCEEDLREWESHNSFDDSSFERVSTLLFGDVLSRMNDLIEFGEILPKHGPGATADRMTGNQKFDLAFWHSRLESLFPYGEFAMLNWRSDNNRYDHVQILEPDAEIPVRVISVPKTLRTPRIIAIEPTCMQYMQQALLGPIVELLESKVVPGNTRPNLAFNFLGFTDQKPNRDLARQGSHEGDLATLDLSEASDRVHILHVEAMLRRFPAVWQGFSATRSTKARVPTLGVDLYSLRKFASMGSALCFPVEAMVFLTSIFLGIEEKLGTPLTRRIVKSYAGKVRVYGDDIIVPVDCVYPVIDTLTRLGFKVNTNKSYWNGKFRESCGGDYYDAHDVTPVRFRRRFPLNRRDVSEVISLVAFRNLLYERGLWQTTKWLDEKHLGKVLPHFPIVEPTSPGLGRRSFLDYIPERIDDNDHSPRVRGYIVKSKLPANSASGLGSLFKCLTSLETRSSRVSPLDTLFSSSDPEHLERSGRPSAVDIKLRWIQPF
jgi:hypothetical protein